MAIIQFEKISLNQFWEKTPTALKYILVITLIILGSYVTLSKKALEGRIQELTKMEQTLSSTYNLIERFEEFQESQHLYSTETIYYLKSLYLLVDQLNVKSDSNFEMLSTSVGNDRDNVLEKIRLLNIEFEKLKISYEQDSISQANKINTNDEIN